MWIKSEIGSGNGVDTLASRTDFEMTSFVPEIAARAKISGELLGQASSLHCCMHLHPAHVVIALADASGGQLVWTEQFELEPNPSDSWQGALSFVRDRNWFEKVFRKCTLTFDTGEYTTIPLAFFESGREAQLLKFHTGKDYQTADVLSLGEFGAQFVFSVPDEIRSITNLFPNVRIFPASWMLARYGWMNASALGASIFIWQTDSKMDMVVLQDRKLLLLRSDHVQSPEDMLYHTSNAALRLGIDLENTAISVFSLSGGKEAEQLFSGYCRSLKTAPETDTAVIIKMHLSCV